MFVFSQRRIMNSFLIFYTQGRLVQGIFKWWLCLFSHSVVLWTAFFTFYTHDSQVQGKKKLIDSGEAITESGIAVSPAPLFLTHILMTIPQSAGAVEYTDCFSAAW